MPSFAKLEVTASVLVLYHFVFVSWVIEVACNIVGKVYVVGQILHPFSSLINSPTC
jgi:hypothetical protein